MNKDRMLTKKESEVFMKAWKEHRKLCEEGDKVAEEILRDTENVLEELMENDPTRKMKPLVILINIMIGLTMFHVVFHLIELFSN